MGERLVKHLPKHPFLHKCTHPYIIKLILLNDIRFEIAFALPFKLYSTINYGAQFYSEPRYALWSSKRESVIRTALVTLIQRGPKRQGPWRGSATLQRAGQIENGEGRVSHPLSPVQGLW